VTRDHGYLLRVKRDHLDAALFQDGFTAGRAALEAGWYAEAAATLRNALDLWRSPVLADLADYAFTRPEAARLEELRLAALEARIDADLALGRHDALVAELEQLAAEHPLRERCTASSCWRCTGAAARPTRSPPTARSATCSRGSSASTPASHRSTCTQPFSHTTQPSTGTREASHSSQRKITEPTPVPRLCPRRQDRLAGGRPPTAGSWPGCGGAPAACWPSARRWRSPPYASWLWPGRERAGQQPCRPTAWA
jgi:Bacterial transcriptional activator domain